MIDPETWSGSGEGVRTVRVKIGMLWLYKVNEVG